MEKARYKSPVTSDSPNSKSSDSVRIARMTVNRNPVPLYQPANQAIEATGKFPKAQPKAMKSDLMTTGFSAH